jgi:hypothetical protein
MIDLLAEIHVRFARIGTEADPLDATERALVGSRRPTRCTVELIRFPGRASTLSMRATFDGLDVPDAMAGWIRRPGEDCVIFERPGETLLAFAAGTLEHEIEGPDVPEHEAAEAMASVPELACFAPLARGHARLVSFGLGTSARHGRIGLVKIHRDLDRGDEDEAALRDAGFSETSDEGVWSTADGARSLVWMGGTVYGYLGPVQGDAVGAWIEE